MQEIIFKESFNFGFRIGMVIGLLAMVIIIILLNFIANDSKSSKNKCKKCRNRLLGKDLFCRQCGTKRYL